MVNGTQMTLDQWMPEIFQRQTAGASEHLVRTSPLPESEPGLKETEVPSFERYFASLKKCGKKIDLNGCSMKMLRECYQATEDLTTLPFSLRWTGGGMILNGAYSTQSFSECHKTGSACLLSDILEVVVPQKYFLSKEQTERIVFTESDTGTDTEGTRKSSTGGGITEALDAAAGGGRGHHTIETIGTLNIERHSDRNVIGVGGVSPTITARDFKDPMKIGVSLSEIRTLRGMG